MRYNLFPPPHSGHVESLQVSSPVSFCPMAFLDIKTAKYRLDHVYASNLTGHDPDAWRCTWVQVFFCLFSFFPLGWVQIEFWDVTCCNGLWFSIYME